MELNKIYNENCLTGLKTLPDNSIDCCVTSPPYFGLRDYGHTEQIGLEETPELYVSKMVEVFNEIKRVLKNEGTLWLNIGDSYASGSKGTGGKNGISFKTNPGQFYEERKFKHGVKDKDLIGIPWLLAFALRADGWYLRQDIIWSKPNPMPESVTDRCTKSHEYIFLLSKSAKYYYDAEAIKTELIEHSPNEYPFSDGTKTETLFKQRGIENESKRKNNLKIYKTPDGWDTGKGSHGTIHREGRSKGKTAKEKTADYGLTGNGFSGHSGNYDAEGNLLGSGKANKRSVWTIGTKPYPDAHFATFPENLIIDMIKAGCPEKGIVLDPFMGAGTTALVAAKLNRNYIGFELNKQYVKIAEKRLTKHLGMFHPNFTA